MRENQSSSESRDFEFELVLISPSVYATVQQKNQTFKFEHSLVLIVDIQGNHTYFAKIICQLKPVHIQKL